MEGSNRICSVTMNISIFIRWVGLCFIVVFAVTTIKEFRDESPYSNYLLPIWNLAILDIIICIVVFLHSWFIVLIQCCKSCKHQWQLVLALMLTVVVAASTLACGIATVVTAIEDNNQIEHHVFICSDQSCRVSPGKCQEKQQDCKAKFFNYIIVAGGSLIVISVFYVFDFYAFLGKYKSKRLAKKRTQKVEHAVLYHPRADSPKATIVRSYDSASTISQHNPMSHYDHDSFDGDIDEETQLRNLIIMDNILKKQAAQRADMQKRYKSTLPYILPRPKLGSASSEHSLNYHEGQSKQRYFKEQHGFKNPRFNSPDPTESHFDSPEPSECHFDTSEPSECRSDTHESYKTRSYTPEPYKTRFDTTDSYKTRFDTTDSYKTRFDTSESSKTRLDPSEPHKTRFDTTDSHKTRFDMTDSYKTGFDTPDPSETGFDTPEPSECRFDTPEPGYSSNYKYREPVQVKSRRDIVARSTAQFEMSNTSKRDASKPRSDNRGKSNSRHQKHGPDDF